MSEHFVVTLDHGHLRIFEERHPPGQHSPALQEVQAIDFPFGKHAYTDRETDAAGRWPNSKHPGPMTGAPMGARVGMSIDERLPMQREEERRRVRELAEHVDGFFRQRPDARWDFAAGPELNKAVLELLSPEVRQRLRRSVTKGLVHQRADEVRAHFAGV